jgi:hypothetical protein
MEEPLMISEAKFYQESGRMNVLAVFGSLLVASIGIAVMGGIYTYAIHLIPFIYINFFLTCGFGFGIGFLIGQAAKFGKVRSQFKAVCLAVIGGAVGLYASWAMHIGVTFGAAGVSTGPVFDPVSLWESIKFLNAEGSWGLGETVAKGWVLAIVWVTEAAIIVGVASVTCMGFVGEIFCERCDQWASDPINTPDLEKVYECEGVFERIVAGDALALLEIPKAFSNTDGTAENEFYLGQTACCHKCGELNTLTVKHVSIDLDNKDKLVRTETPVIERLLITAGDRKKLRQKPWGAEGAKAGTAVAPAAQAEPVPSVALFVAPVTAAPAPVPLPISTAMAGPPAAVPEVRAKPEGATFNTDIAGPPADSFG